MADIKLEIWSGADLSGSLILTAFAGRVGSSERAILIESLEGWEERKIELETVPALFESGSYITRRKVPEFDVSITILLERTNVYSFKDSIRNQILTFSPISLKLEKKQTNTITVSESMNVYPVSIDAFEIINEKNARVTFTARNVSGTISVV